MSAIVSLVALVGLVVNIGLTLWFHYSERAISEERVNTLIDARLRADVLPRLSVIEKRLDNLSVEIDNIKKAVQTLADNQSNETQKIINRILRAASQSSQADKASRLLDTATSLIQALNQDKTPASAVFFSEAIQSLNKITSLTRKGTLPVRLELAEYRSNLNPRPELPTTLASGPITLTLVLLPQLYQVHASVLTRVPNSSLIGSGNSTIEADFVDKDILMLPYTSTISSASVHVQNLIMSNGSQSLDGFSWEGVTFLNMRIRYREGATMLSNVKFVNCTFDFPASPNGESLGNYAALSSREIAIRPANS